MLEVYLLHADYCSIEGMMRDLRSQNTSDTAPANDDLSTDFRSRAVAATEMIRRSVPAGISLESAGISGCFVRQPSLSRFRMPIKAVVGASAILGLGGLASGPILLCLHKGIAPYIAFCCSLAGSQLLLFPTFFERWIVRSLLRPSENDLKAPTRGIHVALEFAPTYGAFKILAEDVGLIYPHPEARFVKMSGLSYDYVIHGKDVVGLLLHSNGKTVLIDYLVGEERLSIAILPRSVLAEFRRQTLGSDASLFERVQNALMVRP
jgi:hypothetical protein